MLILIKRPLSLFCLGEFLFTLLTCNAMEKKVKINFGDSFEGVKVGLFYHKDDDYKSHLLEIYIKNKSMDTIYFASTHILKNFAISIENSEGKTVAMSQEGSDKLSNILNSDFFRRISVQLKPGDIYQVNPSFNLNEWYDLNESEIYQIKATLREGLSKEIHPESAKITIKFF